VTAARLAAWWRYRRRLARFLDIYDALGYRVSPPVYRQLQQHAREDSLRRGLRQAADSVQPASDGLERITARITKPGL